jgi:predicted ATP-dependent endonuclease of OLD family
MKLKNLHIDSYRHLQNISFDFTYPEGHKNEGQPLEKICLIGQSATGKTRILEVIKESISQLERTEIVNDQYIFHHYLLNFKGQVEYLYKDGSIKMTDEKITKNGKEFKNITSGGGAVGSLIPDGLKLLYLSSDVISKEAINIFNQNPVNILNDSTAIDHLRLQELYKKSNYILEFGKDVEAKTWISLLNNILDYRKRFTQMASEIINRGAIADPNKLSKQYAKWAETNKNPLLSFADKFNPVLKKLNLEIDLVNTEYTIPIISHTGDEVIPVADLSTGTKGLLLSMFPLFELDTKDSIILIDEPERSLFPDMQIDLISHYQKLAPNAQFIIATHSPFIAAAFEPEERFILYFDEDGKVAVRRGESPIGDDPNDMLRNDFHVSYYNEFGKAAYKEYLNLQRRAKQEKEPDEKRKLVVEMAKLGNKYNF